MYKTLLFFFFGFLFFWIMMGSRLVHFKRYDDLKVALLTKDKIKSGDVFLISYQNPFRAFGESFLGTRFFHPAITYWDNGELYVLEYAEYTREYNGINKIPFEIWYRINKDSLFLHNSLNYTGDLNLSQEIERYYQKYKDLENIVFNKREVEISSQPKNHSTKEH